MSDTNKNRENVTSSDNEDSESETDSSNSGSESGSSKSVSESGSSKSGSEAENSKKDTDESSDDSSEVSSDDDMNLPLTGNTLYKVLGQFLCDIHTQEINGSSVSIEGETIANSLARISASLEFIAENIKKYNDIIQNNYKKNDSDYESDTSNSRKEKMQKSKKQK